MSAAWRTGTLGSLCRIDLGRTPPRANTEFWDDQKTTANVWLSIGDLLGAQDKLVFDSKEYISDAGAAISKVVKGGTLLLSFKLTLGRLAFAGRDLFTNEAIAALTVVDERELSKDYLYWFLRSVDWFHAGAGDEKVKGVTLNKAKLAQIPIRYPRMAEQLRISTYLDAALSAVGQLRSHANRNLRNAHEIFESILGRVFANAWESSDLVTLAALAPGITDGDHQPPPKSEAGIPFVTISNIVKETRKLDFSGAFTVPREYFDRIRPSRKPRDGDVLYTVTGSFGIPVLVEGNKDFCFQRHIALVRPGPTVDARWLYYLLSSPQVFSQADLAATGTAQRTVSLAALRQLVVPRVDLRRQRQVAAELDAAWASTQQLVDVYQRKSAALDELGRSILHHALDGGL